MTYPDYVVIRAGEGLPPGFLPPHLDGKWFDRRSVPVRAAKFVGSGNNGHVTVSEAVAVPSGRFEVREDGAVAEVWELQL